MGEMYRLAKSFSPNTSTFYRNHWNEGDLFTHFPNHVGELIQEKWREYIHSLSKLPKDKEVYGLIHNDLHQGNFTYYDGEISVFDFGDCEFNWFVQDIAISLYHAVEYIPSYEKEEREQFALNFMR
jgi:Ser/Thr protein kinase RdoA (MazF antagonist)